LTISVQTSRATACAAAVPPAALLQRRSIASREELVSAGSAWTRLLHARTASCEIAPPVAGALVFVVAVLDAVGGAADVEPVVDVELVTAGVELVWLDAVELLPHPDTSAAAAASASASHGSRCMIVLLCR
jgi:energy-converting hydrogenase Eha subunit E